MGPCDAMLSALEQAGPEGLNGEDLRQRGIFWAEEHVQTLRNRGHVVRLDHETDGTETVVDSRYVLGLR